MKVCFLLTHIPNPRINKRIDIFKEWTDTYVICTRRASQNIWEPVHNVQHVVYDIDLPSAKRIVKRYFVSQNFQKKALSKLLELKPDIIYAEGLDTLIIANEYKKNHDVKIVYEVADLREIFVSKPRKVVDKIMSVLLKKKEEREFRGVDFLVVTSPKFYESHYKYYISRERMMFIPNAPNKEIFEGYRKKQGGAFTVGFIGAIRYLYQMKMLVDCVEIVDCNVLFAGAGGTYSDYEEIMEYCNDNASVQFTGKYDYNKQIAELYGMVDCVYAVYDADNPNVQIALPNKLYEAIMCELPIIVAKGTYLEELVTKWGVGISVGHKNVKELADAIGRLQNDKDFYNSIVNKCKIYKEMFNTSEYAEKLKNRLIELF